MITFRPATATDAPAVSKLFARTCAVSLPFLKVLHSPAEDLQFFGRQIAEGIVTLAEDDNRLLGFICESPGRVEHLYVDPETQGQGIGRTLLRLAQARQDQLDLWCFAENLRGRAFYERLGFRAVRETLGENEQNLPDILYRWER